MPRTVLLSLVAFMTAVTAQREGISIQDLVLLDAVPWPETREMAPDLLPLRLLSLTSPASPMNAFGAIKGLHEAIPFPFTHVHLEGTSHVDPESPPGLGGRFLGSERGRREYARRFLAFLTSDNANEKQGL